MRKYLIVVSSFLIMATLGGLYAWSIFVPPLKEQIGVSTGFTQIIFGLIIGILPVAMVFGGRLLESKGPMYSGIISGILFGAGYIMAGKSGARPLFLITGIGLMSGIGTGFGYIAALSSPVKWFPQKRGLITGIATSGFGAGAIFLSFIVRELLKTGMPVSRIFMIIGITYGLIIITASLFLNDPKDTVKSTKSAEWNLDFLKDTKFWALFWGMFSGAFAGLVIIGNLKPLALYFGIDSTSAILAISSLSMGNTAGRILWGYIADRIGIQKSIRLSLIIIAILIPIYAFVKSGLLFVILSLFIGLAFGANFVLYATGASIFFGIERIGEIYPFVSFAYGIAGLTGPPAGGYAYDITGSYIYSLIISSLVAFVGSIAAIHLIKQHLTHRLPESVKEVL